MKFFSSLLAVFSVSILNVYAFQTRLFKNPGVLKLHKNLVHMTASFEIAMPALSSTMKEGKIVSWLKKPGDRIEKGDMVSY